MIRDNEALDWLSGLTERNAYPAAVLLDDTHYAAIYPMAFNDTIIMGKIGDDTGWDEQWWYERGEAGAALFKWHVGGGAEPEGWHRHIPSNRRRENGDPTKEEIRP